MELPIFIFFKSNLCSSRKNSVTSAARLKIKINHLSWHYQIVTTIRKGILTATTKHSTSVIIILHLNQFVLPKLNLVLLAPDNAFFTLRHHTNNHGESALRIWSTNVYPKSQTGND